MARYHNKNMRVYIGVGSGGTASALLAVSDWSIDLSTDTVETTSGGDTNKNYVQGLASGEVSMSGFWDDTETKLVTGQASATGVKFYGYPDVTNAASKYVSGVFWMSVAFQNSVSDAAKWTATLVPNSSITNNL